MPDHDRDVVDGLLIGVMILGLGLAVAAVFGVGLSLSVAGVRISARTLFRPIVIAMAAGLVAVQRSQHRQRQLTTLWSAAQHHGSAIAVCLAVFVFAIAMRMSLFEARASDQYGYLSQAVLWTQGNLTVHQPLAAIAPWPDASWTVAPLGYRPGQHPATIVPTYPAGLPLLMAGFIKLFGPFGAFLVVPLLGSLAVLLTFFLGRSVSGTACGLLAAMLLITSPIFLYQLIEPMSDVPATAWWLLVIVLVAAPGGASALGGGLASSAAILTRPNVVPLALLLGFFLLTYSHGHFRTRLRGALLFGVGVLPGCVGVALLNRTLYGSPFSSGYGSSEVLFKIEHLTANVSTYPRWLIQTETPVVLLAVLAPWLIRVPLVWLLAAIPVTLFGCYAFYLPFDNWTYLRFLLPGIPALLILSSAVLLHFLQRVGSRSTRWLIAAACVMLMAWRWDVLGLHPPRPFDRRFAVVGQFVRDELPPNAIFISMQHSGSVRYYSGRSTLRWDWLPAEWLDPAVAFLRANGYRPLFLLEEWERPLFTERFGAHTTIATLDWPPIATYSGAVNAHVFDPADRGRSASSIKTRTIQAVTVPQMR
jgi:hypothetical protein